MSAMVTDGGGAAPTQTETQESGSLTPSDSGLTDIQSPVQAWIDSTVWTREDLELILSVLSVIATLIMVMVQVL